MASKLSIKSVISVFEVEPAIFEIVLLEESGQEVRLRVNVFALQDLNRKMTPYMGS